MSFFEAHADAFISSIITILGFIVAILISQKSIRDEIRKDKISNSNKVIQELLFEICQVLNSALRSPSNFDVSNYQTLSDRILAYGSRHAVSIIVCIQELILKKTKEQEDFGNRLMALFCLLITQLKYDLTDEIIAPDSWMRMRLKDYDTVGNDLKIISNSYVIELGLKKEFILR